MQQQDLIVQTTALIAGGAAIGRLPDGRAVFVDGGAPNELVSIELTHEDKRWAKARILEIIESSNDRVEPPFFPSALGGAAWAHIDYQAQLAAKQQIVRTAIERIGRLLDPTIEPIIASPQQWRYRNRIELTFGTKDGEVILGTLKPGSDSEVIAADDVTLFPEVIEQIIPKVLAWARQSGLLAWSPRDHSGQLRSLIVRRSVRGHFRSGSDVDRNLFGSERERIAPLGDLVIQLITSSTAKPDTSFVVALEGVPTTGILWSHSIPRKHLRGDQLLTSEEFPKDTAVVLSGSPTLTETIADCVLSYHATSFFQVNIGAATLLIEQLRKRTESPSELIDLYAGVGLLGLTTTEPSTLLTLVESDPQASRDALQNVEQLGRLDTTTIVAASAEDYMSKYRIPEGATVFVDPPRAGLDHTVVDALVKAKVSKLIYVSCDPATLARDLKLLSAKYQPVFIQPFDFFPQTPHIETLVELLPISSSF